MISTNVKDVKDLSGIETYPNPVGSTSKFSNLESESLIEFLRRNYPKSVIEHGKNADHKGIFSQGFDGFAYSMKVAILNDTVRVSLEHPRPEHSFFAPKNGGQNGKPPFGIAKHSIFDDSKTGITSDRSVTGMTL